MPKRIAFKGQILGLAACGLAMVGSAAPAQTTDAGGQQAISPAMLSKLPPITSLPRSPMIGEIPLYPASASTKAQEQWETYLGGPIVRNVVNPTLTPMAPPAGKANGTAVIYAPGGGFRYLAVKEDALQNLRNLGVTVFVLKYRLEPTDRDPQTFLKNLYAWLFSMVAMNQQTDPADRPTLHATPEAIADALAAIRYVRKHAAEWGVEPNRIGLMGGSAGAATAMDVALTKDDEARPDFVVAMYGPKKIDPVPATAPPLFLASSVDDPLFPGSSENVVAAWSKAKRPIEAHLYEKGGHGLAAGTTGEQWFDSLALWMKQHGWLPQAKP